jgi:hypothetical protein
LGLGNLFGRLKYWISIVSHTIEKLVGSYKKGSVEEGAPLSVVTQVPITGDVREDVVATTRAGFAFMDANHALVVATSVP